MTQSSSDARSHPYILRRTAPRSVHSHSELQSILGAPLAGQLQNDVRALIVTFEAYWLASSNFLQVRRDLLCEHENDRILQEKWIYQPGLPE